MEALLHLISRSEGLLEGIRTSGFNKYLPLLALLDMLGLQGNKTAVYKEVTCMPALQCQPSVGNGSPETRTRAYMLLFTAGPAGLVYSDPHVHASIKELYQNFILL